MTTVSLNDSSLWIAADTETAGLNAQYDVGVRLHCLQVHVNGVPLIVTDREDIQRYLTTYTPCFVNAAFDVAVLRTHGYDITCYHDLALANYQLIGARSADNNSLDGMAERYLGKHKSTKPSNWAVFDAQAQQYAIDDVVLTHELLPKVLLKLQNDFPDSWNTYVNVDLPYVENRVEMYQRGTHVDVNELEPLIPEYDKAIESIVTQHTALYGYRQGAIDKVTHTSLSLGGMPIIREVVNGVTVNRRAKCDIEPVSLRGSDRQRVLTTHYSKLAETLPRTASGLIKTDKHTLSNIADVCPAAELWLTYESRTKQLSTFLLPLIKKATNGGGTIRANVHGCNTRTGRLSYYDPNLQQVPAHGERGAEVRKAFTAPDGYKVVVGDLDRIELVVLAFYLKELLGHTVLADRLSRGDPHSEHAEAWGCSRDAAKRGGFCTVYGGGFTKLALVTGLSRHAAKDVMSAINTDLRLEEYRTVFANMAAHNKGYITNYFSRRLYLPEVLSSDKSERAAGKRKCGNYPIQSTAGDVFKLLQVAANKVRLTHGLVNEVAYQSLVVHDEVIYIVKDAHVDTFINKVEPCYNSTSMFNGIAVNLKFGVGNNWYEAKGAA